MKDGMIYIGTYTNGKSEGIYKVHMDISGRLEVEGLAARLENPSYLAMSGDGSYLYSVIETEKFEGNAGGAVAAFKVKNPSGDLELMNIASTEGTGPCHLTIDKNNRFLYTANYGEGSVTAFSLEDDGSIGKLKSHIRHEGSGPDRERQEGPHAHFVIHTPDEKYLCAVDLGLDAVIMYDVCTPNTDISTAGGSASASGISQDSAAISQGPASDRSSVINPANCHIARISPGKGPRHLVFHPNEKFAYLINELSSDIAVLQYSMGTGELNEKQYISTLPEKYAGESYCAAIKISRDGKFLYGSNRGHDSIAVFSIDPDSGLLSQHWHQSTSGSFPRDFDINPAGTLLVAANQNSGTLVSFYIDRNSGSLEPTGYTATIPDAVCVKFANI